MRSDNQRPLSTHVMDGHCNVRLTDLLKLLRISPNPELNSCIPTAAYNKAWTILRVLDAENFLYRLCMCSYYENLALQNVPFVNVVVSRCNKDTWLVQLPAYSKNTCWNFLSWNLPTLSFGHPIWSIWIDINLKTGNGAVPLRNSHQVCAKLTIDPW